MCLNSHNADDISSISENILMNTNLKGIEHSLIFFIYNLLRHRLYYCDMSRSVTCSSISLLLEIAPFYSVHQQQLHGISTNSYKVTVQYE